MTFNPSIDIVSFVLHGCAIIATLMSILDMSGVISAPDVSVFILGCLGLLIIAGKIGDVTEEIEKKTNPLTAGLANAAFGNFPELAFGTASLFHQEYDFLMATLIGSIVSNCLLVLGMSIFAGAWRNSTQQCDPKFHCIHTSGAIALVLSTVFYAIVSLCGTTLSDGSNQHMNLLIGALLILNYIVNNIFTFRAVTQAEKGLVKNLEEFISPMVRQKTTRTLNVSVDNSPAVATPTLASILYPVATVSIDVNAAAKYGSTDATKTKDVISTEEENKSWTWIMGWLMYSLVIVAFISEAITSRVTNMATDLNITPRFTGAVLVAILGNCCEHWSAIKSAWDGNIDTGVQIPMASSLQIIMLLIPFFSFLSLSCSTFLPLALDNVYLISLLSSSIVVCFVLSNQRPNIYHGMMLISLYIVIAGVFFSS